MNGGVAKKDFWYQGAIVDQTDNAMILEGSGLSDDDSLTLVVASHSCDIANRNFQDEPCIELSVARSINQLNPQLTANLNPRKLHTSLMVRTNDRSIFKEQYVELLAFEKHQVPKQRFIDVQPDPNRQFSDQYLYAYVAWLAARYSRPALPDEFDQRIAAVGKTKKHRKLAKQLNPYLSGIYVEIQPNCGIPETENYRVNLLGLVSPDFAGDVTSLMSSLQQYADIMAEAKMDVIVKIRREDEVSVADIKRFQRFYYDDLSFKHDAPLPAEVTESC